MKVHTRTVWDIESGQLLADEAYEYTGPLELCNIGTGAKKDLFQNEATGQNISATGQNNAASLYGTLNPTLTTMATNPQGINPADMAKIQTSNMQTAGGANAGAVGQGSLLAARTKNAGTADAAIAKSGEAAGQNLSRANLATQNENIGIKNQQQEEGLKGLQGLYGTNEAQALGGLNASNNALATEIKAPQSFWQKYLQGAGANAMNGIISGVMGGGG
jgi:hypothetical protein